MRPLIDTGVLLALLDSRDSHHQWSKTVAALQPKGFVTCEAVISELFFMFGPVSGPNTPF